MDIDIDMDKSDRLTVKRPKRSASMTTNTMRIVVAGGE